MDRRPEASRARPCLPSLRQLGLCATLLALMAGTGVGCGPRRSPPAAFEGKVLEQRSLESGLHIEIMREGQGQRRVAEGDWVALHYATRLSGGQEEGRLVELSRKPLDFIVGRSQGLIEGLQQGVLGMRPGELRRLRIPPKLGYRGRAMGSIPADAELRMDLELVQLEPGQAKGP